jgi:hypothetical protein
MDVRVDTLAADSGRITGKPEVISSHDGLVPTNALVDWSGQLPVSVGYAESAGINRHVCRG